MSILLRWSHCETVESLDISLHAAPMGLGISAGPSTLGDDCSDCPVGATSVGNPSQFSSSHAPVGANAKTSLAEAAPAEPFQVCKR